MEGTSDNHLVCRACMKILEVNKSSYGYIEDDHGNLKEMVMCCVPEMDLYISEDPVMCFPCIQLLILLHNFKTRCFNSETLIRSYFQKHNLTDDNQINLVNVVHDLIQTNNYSNLDEQQNQLLIRSDSLEKSPVPAEINFLSPVPQTPVPFGNSFCGHSSSVPYDIGLHRLQPPVNSSSIDSSVISPSIQSPSVQSHTQLPIDSHIQQPYFQTPPIPTFPIQPPLIPTPPPLQPIFHPYHRMSSPDYFRHRSPMTFSNSWCERTRGPVYSNTPTSSFNSHRRQLGTMYLNGGPLIRQHLPPVNSHDPPPLYHRMPSIRNPPLPNFQRLPTNNSGHPLMLIINRTPSKLITPSTVIPLSSKNEISGSVVSECCVVQSQNNSITPTKVLNNVPEKIIDLKQKTDLDLNSIESKRRLMVKFERNKLIESMIEGSLSECNDEDKNEDSNENKLENNELLQFRKQNPNIFQCIGCMYLTTSPTFFAEHRKACTSTLDKDKSDIEEQNPVLENSVLENPVLENSVLENPVLENSLLENSVLEETVAKDTHPINPITWHACEHCNYKTTEKFCLRRHSRTLHPEFPFNGDLNCPFCIYRTTSNHHLKRHMIKHEVDNTLRCQFCSYSSKDRSNFRRHVFIHSPNIIQCEYCDYKNSSPYAIKCHLRKYHHGVGQEDVDCKSEQPLEDVVKEISTAIKSQNTQGQEME